MHSHPMMNVSSCPSATSGRVGRREDSQGVMGPDGKVEGKKQRKRLQNRINQRAHRLRLREREVEIYPNQSPFRIHRWRVQKPLRPLDSIPGASLRSPHSGALSEQSSLKAKRSGLELPPELEFPLSADHHLLHLIRYNVFRAFVLNMRIMDRLATHFPSPTPSLAATHMSGPCWRYGTTHPIDLSLPVSLRPTQTQMSKVHISWINQMPIPALRDNLIKKQASFSHWEFLKDLLGELVDRAWYHEVTPQISKPSQDHSEKAADIALTRGGEHGLIVWGEPHMEENWEATPGFFTTWSWALEGCEKLVEITNRWRAQRGEDPIFPPRQMIR